MLIATHLEQLTRLSGIATRSIKPVKFGFQVNWSAATAVTLAAIEIPDNAALVIMRVECSTVNWDTAATDFGLVTTHPPGKAYWLVGDAIGAGRPVTNKNAPAHLVLDTDEFLLVAEKTTLTLIEEFDAPPDAYLRKVRTTVYGYFVPVSVAEALATSELFHKVIS